MTKKISAHPVDDDVATDAFTDDLLAAYMLYALFGDAEANACMQDAEWLEQVDSKDEGISPARPLGLSGEYGECNECVRSEYAPKNLPNGAQTCEDAHEAGQAANLWEEQT